MTPTTVIEASNSLIAQLAIPAVRAVALAGAAGLGLAAFRVKATAARLLTWSAVLYAALAMPLMGWILPPLTVPTPAFLQHLFLQDGTTHVVRGQLSSANASGTVMLSEERTARNAMLARSRSTPASLVVQREVGIATGVNQRTTPEAERINPSQPRAETPSSPQSSISWSAVVTAIYLAVASLLLLRFIIGLAFSRRLLRASLAIDDPRVTAKLASRARASGLAFIPQAAESELISVPVTMGAQRSTILLPTAWREWDESKLDAVVAHEVSHVARRDPLTQRLSLLHRAIFWFSPLAWWLDHHLANLAEQASDEAALSCGADRKHYARTLLEFFEALQAAPGRVWWQGVSMAKAGQAEQRVERILSWKGNVTMGFNKSEFKKSPLKRSITVAVVTLAVPVVYLAAAVHPANYKATLQIMHPPVVAQDQTPPPAPNPVPAPQAQPNAVPEPALAPSADATPMPAPAAAPAPHAVTISGATAGIPAGKINGGVYSVAPRAPVAAVAPRASTHPLAPVAPVAPGLPATPPVAWAGVYSSDGHWSSQSATSASSSASASRGSSGWGRSRGSSYSYGYDENQRFVIASGKTDSLTMSGSTEDAEHVERLKKTISGDFIWFERDEKSYVIRDQATIDRARKFWAPQEDLGKKQEALGKQQEILGTQQEELGAKMEQIHVNVPDMTEQIDKLKAEVKQLSSSATMEQVSHLQSEIGDLQSKIGDLQSQAGDQQSKLGEQMGVLGEKQGKLGEEQGKLGEQQGELARQASRQMKQLLDEALTKGTAQPEQ